MIETPFRIRQDGLNSYAILEQPHPIDGGEYAPICTVSTMANVEFIVRACNSYDDMLAFIEKVAAWDFQGEDSFDRIEEAEQEAFELIKKVRGK